MFASGSPPDIVHLAAFEYQQFADQGFMEPLDKWIKGDDSDLIQSLLDPSIPTAEESFKIVGRDDDIKKIKQLIVMILFEN